MKDRIANPVILDKYSVWIPDNRKTFHYSDGRLSEWYLTDIFSKAGDLSSDSGELEKYIIDWPSEYHLSRKRANLLRGFDFDRSKKVLEVGCGCGAITRFLGENFDDVLAVEGSISRARLARMRTRNMSNVSILCAPFQEIRFTQQFDIIFCIGVFEYSGMFVSGSTDPYNTILKYFHDGLSDDGIVVIAIENQFGLKYFASAREDHTGIRFDGLEGYPRTDKAKTFGYDELKSRLSRYFAEIEFYFPYPDYKIPSCVLSENFFSKVSAGELVGQFRSRYYTGKQKPLFDEQLVLSELDKNHKLPFFSNSFLVVAGKETGKSLHFPHDGIMFSASGRIREFETVSRFSEDDTGNMQVRKIPSTGQERIAIGKLALCSYTEPWIQGESLQFHLRRRMKDKHLQIEDIFAPCRIWLKSLTADAVEQDNRVLLNGKYIDRIWRNAYITDDTCVFIDDEWEWQENIDLRVLLIRSIYLFLDDIQDIKDIPPFLKKNSVRRSIREIAESMGITLIKEDFDAFIALQSEMNSITLGSEKWIKKINLQIYLRNKKVYAILRKLFSSAGKTIRWIKFLLHYALTTVRHT